MTFNGAVPNQLSLHPWELAILPQRTVTVTFQENGKSVTHTEQGPYVADALTFAGWQPIAACRNDLLRWWIVASNAKGQTALMTRGEIDPGFGNRQAILSISEDGHFLSASGGPRLIVPGDATSGRAIKNVNQVTVGRATSQLAQTGCDDVGKVATPPPAGSVLINGDVANPMTLTTAQLQQIGLRTMNVNFLNGANPVTAAEQGPLLEDVIRMAKPKIDNRARTTRSASTSRPARPTATRACSRGATSRRCTATAYRCSRSTRTTSRSPAGHAYSRPATCAEAATSAGH